MPRFRRLEYAFLYLVSGSIFGLLLLEGLLRCNTTLLQRGMALPAPVDPPLTVMEYDVRYSDADAFHWRPDLVRPVPASADRLEARVVYETDEYGFRNHPPIPPRVDVVVLGRSISLAGHLARPWPDLLASGSGWRVFNLSQPGSGIGGKRTLLDRFGLPRHPKWVIVEVVPSIDIVNSETSHLWMSEQLFAPVLQGLIRRLMADKPVSSENAVYPLGVDLPRRKVDLTCCLHYMEFFSLDEQALRASQDWANYSRELVRLINQARAADACVALLYVPTKPDVYFPLALHPGQLTPVLRETIPYRLGSAGAVEPDGAGRMTVDQVRRNALAGHDLVEGLAREQGVLWIDPNEAIVRSVLEGQDPFMVYDSHWNQLGHQVVAETVIESLNQAACP